MGFLKFLQYRVPTSILMFKSSNHQKLKNRQNDHFGGCSFFYKGRVKIHGLTGLEINFRKDKGAKRFSDYEKNFSQNPGKGPTFSARLYPKISFLTQNSRFTHSFCPKTTGNALISTC